MSSTIRIKRSSVRGKIPNTSNISTGELALNLADKRLYTSNGTATFEIGTNPDSLSVGSGGFSLGNGSISFPVSDGTADQILVTDGAGNLTFVDQAIARANSVPISLKPTKLDAITVNGNTSYTLTANSSAHVPKSQNGLLVSLNGVIQEPGDSFTVTGSTITFDRALEAGRDVVNFVIDISASGTLFVTNEVVSYKFISANNTITANNFVGDGSQLTGLNYNNISNAPSISNNLANTNAYIATTQGNIDTLESTVNANLANTNAYIATTQGNIDTLESTVNANLANTNAYIATKLDSSTASATYVTKADAVASNNVVVSLINDRLQVANAVSTYATISTVNANLANTNAYIATTQGNIDTLESTVNSNLANTNAYIASNYSTLWSALTSTNTAIRSSISSEIASLVDSAPATLDTLNELAAALGDDANFSTTVTNLIGTKLSVANAVSTYATISNVNANLANTNAYIASTQVNIDTLETTVNSNLANTNAYIATKLDINPTSLTVGSGTFAIANGAITFPTVDGANSQILTTNGQGQLQFVSLEQATPGAGYDNSTVTDFPTGDSGSDESFVGDPSVDSLDAFGVPVGGNFDCMDPVGRIVTEDLGTI
jgi:uncharacterized membrane protein (GlpM family)